MSLLICRYIFKQKTNKLHENVSEFQYIQQFCLNTLHYSSLLSAEWVTNVIVANVLLAVQ